MKGKFILGFVFLILLSSFVSAIVETNPFPPTATTPSDAKTGMKFNTFNYNKVTNNLTIDQVTVHGSSTANDIYLQNSTHGTIASGTLIGNKYNFSNIQLEPNTIYYIVTDNSGSTYTATYESSGVSYPQAGTYLNWTAGTRDNFPGFGDEATLSREITEIILNYNSLTPPVVLSSNFTVNVTNVNTFNVTVDSMLFTTTTGQIITNITNNDTSLYDVTIIAEDYIDRFFDDYNVSSNITVTLTEEKSVNVTFLDYINESGTLYLNDNLTIQYHFFNCPANQTIDFSTNGVLRDSDSISCTGSDVYQNITYRNAEGFFNTSFYGTYNNTLDYETYSFNGLNFTADYTNPSVEYLQALNTTTLSNDLTEFFNITDNVTYIDSCSIDWLNIDTGYNTSTACNSSLLFGEAGVYNITINATDIALNSNITTSQFKVNPNNNITFIDATSSSPITGATITVYNPNSGSTSYVTNGTGTIVVPSLYNDHIQEGDYVFSFPNQQGYVTPINFTKNVNATDVPYTETYSLYRANLTVYLRDAVTGDLITDNMSVDIQDIGSFTTVTGILFIENLSIASGQYGVYVYSDDYIFTQKTLTYTNQEVLTTTVYAFNRNTTNLGTTTATIYDSFDDKIVGADVRLQQFDPVTTSFAEVSQCFSDSNGQCSFPVLLQSVAYRIYATATVNGATYDGYSTDSGAIIYLDETQIGVRLDTIVIYGDQYLDGLTINVTNTTLINNVSYHTVDYYDAFGTTHEVCLGYYYLDGVVEKMFTELCDTGSSGTINYNNITGYAFNRSLTNIVKAYVKTTDKNILYYEQAYTNKNSFENTLGDIIKPLILLGLILALGISLYLKRIEYFIFLEIALAVVWNVVSPTFYGGVGLALNIILSLAVLNLAKKKTNANEV